MTSQVAPRELADVQAGADPRGVEVDEVGVDQVSYPVVVVRGDGSRQATVAEVTEGGGLFFQYCRRCHNPDFNYVKSGSIPDLRRANEATHATFEQIMLGGARRTLGMPSFAKDLSSDQVRMIHAYVLEQARQASNVRTLAEGGH